MLTEWIDSFLIFLISVSPSGSMPSRARSCLVNISLFTTNSTPPFWKKTHYTDPTGPLVWLNVHRSALGVQLSDVLSLSRQSIQFSRKCDTIFHTASLTRGFIAKVRDFWDHETFRLLTKVFGVKKHDETLRVIPRSSDSNIKQKLTTLQVLSVKNVKSLLIFFV